MKRILLVFPPYTREALSYYPPLGLGYIASYILSKNPELEVKILDFTIEKFSVERWKKELQNFDPEIVGISVLTFNFPLGAFIARLTKKLNPRILTVMGGAHATAVPEDCLEYCDIAVRGEGEATFWDIVQEKELKSIQGISYRSGGKVNHNEKRERIKTLDDLPFPAHFLFKTKNYECFPSWGVMGSRGCPYNCIFCSSPNRWNRIIRFRSVRNIVDEIEYLHKNFNIRAITFFDDTINITQRRALEICDEIVRRGLHKKMSFTCQMKANRQLVSLELFKKMKEANFVQVEFGIESGSQKVLDSIRKSLTVSEAKQAVDLARKARIHVVKGFFMIGNWDETISDVLKTWQFVLSVKAWPTFSICTPFPGTVLYQMLKDGNYLPQDLDLSKFNQTTPITRTNKMSKTCVFLLYACSVGFLQLPLAVSRGHSFKHTISKIMTNIWDKTVNKDARAAREIWK
jgi:anaerobic magnesium-protoporphyrin IX monomethyl ester cyclase